MAERGDRGNSFPHANHSLNPPLSANPTMAPQFRFSLIETLYARGFTRVDQVKRLTSDQFQAALRGTIAYDQAAAMFEKAVPPSSAISVAAATAHGGFVPVNAEGSLVDYTPPINLFPLGPAAYLHDLLALAVGKTTLGELVSTRRGPVHLLHATPPNLSSELPSIDLVIESLEALGSNLSKVHGAAYDTADCKSLASAFGYNGGEANGLLDALPEHSSPGKPASAEAKKKAAREAKTAAKKTATG